MVTHFQLFVFSRVTLLKGRCIGIIGTSETGPLQKFPHRRKRGGSREAAQVETFRNLNPREYLMLKAQSVGRRMNSGSGYDRRFLAIFWNEAVTLFWIKDELLTEAMRCCVDVGQQFKEFNRTTQNGC